MNHPDPNAIMSELDRGLHAFQKETRPSAITKALATEEIDMRQYSAPALSCPEKHGALKGNVKKPLVFQTSRPQFTGFGRKIPTTQKDLRALYRGEWPINQDPRKWKTPEKFVNTIGTELEGKLVYDRNFCYHMTPNNPEDRYWMSVNTVPVRPSEVLTVDCQLIGPSPRQADLLASLLCTGTVAPHLMLYDGAPKTINIRKSNGGNYEWECPLRVYSDFVTENQRVWFVRRNGGTVTRVMATVTNVEQTYEDDLVLMEVYEPKTIVTVETENSTAGDQVLIELEKFPADNIYETELYMLQESRLPDDTDPLASKIIERALQIFTGTLENIGDRALTFLNVGNRVGLSDIKLQPKPDKMAGIFSLLMGTFLTDTHCSTYSDGKGELEADAEKFSSMKRDLKNRRIPFQILHQLVRAAIQRPEESWYSWATDQGRSIAPQFFGGAITKNDLPSEPEKFDRVRFNRPGTMVQPVLNSCTLSDFKADMMKMCNGGKLTYGNNPIWAIILWRLLPFGEILPSLESYYDDFVNAAHEIEKCIDQSFEKMNTLLFAFGESFARSAKWVAPKWTGRAESLASYGPTVFFGGAAFKNLFESTFQTGDKMTALKGLLMMAFSFKHIRKRTKELMHTIIFNNYVRNIIKGVVLSVLALKTCFRRTTEGTFGSREYVKQAISKSLTTVFGFLPESASVPLVREFLQLYFVFLNVRLMKSLGLLELAMSPIITVCESVGIATYRLRLSEETDKFRNLAADALQESRRLVKENAQFL
jgi:hypothetical protein